MLKSSRIFIAGHRGLAGSALFRRFAAAGYTNLLVRTHTELDLENQEEVRHFFQQERPEYVLLAAAKVGGIMANETYPADFILKNLKIQNNVIEAAWRSAVSGLLFLGSACIYPKLAAQPLREECILTGLLEPTNEPYAIAKIAGLELCEAFNRQYGTRFLSVMPINLYGPNDNYDLEKSHVIPALIRKFHLGKLAMEGDTAGILRDEERYGPIFEPFRTNLFLTAEAQSSQRLDPPCPPATGGGPLVSLWGTGTPRREFLYSDDLADACLFLLQRLEDIFSEPDLAQPADSHSRASRHLFNIGCGKDTTVRELADVVSRVIGFKGEVEWDSTKPDGTPQKLMDISRLTEMGWRPGVSFEEGVRLAYRNYLGMDDV